MTRMSICAQSTRGATEDRLRCDQRRDLREHSTSQALTEDGEAPSFVVTQLQPSTAQLSLENPALLAHEFDYVPLFPFEPSEQRRNKEMKRNHCASRCQCLIDAVLRHNARASRAIAATATPIAFDLRTSNEDGDGAID